MNPWNILGWMLVFMFGMSMVVFLMAFAAAMGRSSRKMPQEDTREWNFPD